VLTHTGRSFWGSTAAQAPEISSRAPLDGTASDWLLNIRPIVPPGASRCPSVRRKSDVAIRV
jgi:hypothetical protein